MIKLLQEQLTEPFISEEQYGAWFEEDLRAHGLAMQQTRDVGYRVIWYGMIGGTLQIVFLFNVEKIKTDPEYLKKEQSRNKQLIEILEREGIMSYQSRETSSYGGVSISVSDNTEAINDWLMRRGV